MNHVLERAEDHARFLWNDVCPTGAQEHEVVRLSGRINFECSMETRKTLLRAVAQKRGVFVDLSKVTHIDGSGLASLVEALQVARHHGADLVLFSVGKQVMQILKIARLDLVFRIVERMPVVGLGHIPRSDAFTQYKCVIRLFQWPEMTKAWRPKSRKAMLPRADANALSGLRKRGI